MEVGVGVAVVVAAGIGVNVAVALAVAVAVAVGVDVGVAVAVGVGVSVSVAEINVSLTSYAWKANSDSSFTRPANLSARNTKRFPLRWASANQIAPVPERLQRTCHHACRGYLFL